MRKVVTRRNLETVRKSVKKTNARIPNKARIRLARAERKIASLERQMAQMVAMHGLLDWSESPIEGVLEVTN